jgi:tight adherence protein B
LELQAMLTIISLVVFVLVALLVFAVGSFLDQRSAQARMLRDRLASVQKAEQQSNEELALLRDEMMSKIPALDSLLRRSERMANFQVFLEQSDLKVRAGNILVLCVVSAVVVGVIGYFVAGSLPPNQALLFVMVGVVLGGALPYSYASYRRTKRFQKFEELFPNAIDTLARAVRAGHAFTTALELIANEISEPIASEFRKLFEEQKFGLPVRDALMNLAGRMPLVDVKFFVTAVMLQRETGGNLAEILDNLSYVIRERFKIMRQVRVYTAQGRLTMMLLMGLPPIIVVVMLTTNPAFIRPLFADPIGHTLVVAGIVLQTIGYFVIRKIIQIQV